MADNLNIKNPSVLPGDLDLRTDDQGYITSISGHPIAGGGGGGGITYYGDDEYIQYKNGTVNTFTVTDKIKDVVDDFAGNVSVLIDAQTYNKSSIDTMLSAIDTMVSAKQDKLVFAGSADKIETINGSGFIVNGYVSSSTYQMDKFIYNKKIDNLYASVSSKQDQIIFEYDEDNKVSAINGSALAGQGGTTYTPGQYINIDSNNEISVTGLVAIDEYATYSGDWNDVSNSYKTNSGSFITKDVNDLTNYYPKTQTSSDSELAEAFGSILKYDVTAAAGIEITTATDVGVTTYGISMTAQPVVTDTRLSGYNGIAAEPDGNVSGLWDVGLTQDMLNTINGKLDSTVAAQTYQPKGNYVSSTDISDMATKTWVGNQGYLTQATEKDWTNTIQEASSKAYNDATANANNLYQTKGDYATNTNLQIVSAGVDYVSAHAITAHQSLTNYYTKSETSGAEEISTALGNKVDKPSSLVNKYLVLRTNNDGSVSGWVDFNENVYSKSEADGRYQKKEDMGSYLTTAKYQTDSATFVTSSNASISAAGEQYALTTTGWAKVQAGQSLDAGSGISIDSNKINVKIGDNLKFLNSNNTVITTEDNLSASSFGVYTSENYYTKIDKNSITKYSKSGDEIDTISLNSIGLETIFTGPNRNISANYDVNHLFFKSYDNNGEYSGNYSQIEMKVLQEQNPAATQHKSTIVLTDYDGTSIKTGLIDVDRIAAWDAAAGGSFGGVTTDDTLTGIGTDASHKLGVAWSALSSYTIDYSNSAFNLTNGTTVSSFDQISSAINNKVNKTLSFNVGTGNTVVDDGKCIVMGNRSYVSGNSVSFCDDNTAKDNSLAFGWGSSAKLYSLAGGYHCSADTYSISLAQENIATGHSFSIGHANTAYNYAGAIGRGLSIDGSDYGALVVGRWNNISSNALFVVGNGSATTGRSDAFVVKTNGTIQAGNLTYAGGGACFTQGAWTSADGAMCHAEGVATSAIGYGIHAEGCWTLFSANSATPSNQETSNAAGVFVGGICNATSSHNYGEATAHSGVLAVYGNGRRNGQDNYTRSDAYILYRDGTVSAKQYKAEGYTQNNTYVEGSVPKSLPNTGDNTMVVQKMFVCTSDNDIISHSNSLSNGEGCIFFRVG